jgi:hypothetical protein
MERTVIRERSISLNVAPGFHFVPSGLRRKKEKKEAERRKTLFHNLRACARRASGGTRTPSGVPRRLLSKGLTHPKDSASDQASRDRHPKQRASLRPAPAPVTASTSRAGHSAGRHDVRCRPGAKVTSPCPRAPQPAPPDGVSGRRPCKRARSAFLVRRTARDQAIPPAGNMRLIRRQFCSARC